ncbi:ATP-binding protein [Vibrio sp. 99-70-13A1]|uniref:ATP-binding protein n=1 Tax=Vibrio sp. 99-70-13A1 TaxID=2607601 RepID=UPI001493D5D6|nr:ATP-binding protein [Vibrio sp. 99-70-13A1]NOH98974.1 hypothetical protein [Vibrio sp. 99-70-13A1]
MLRVFLPFYIIIMCAWLSGEWLVDEAVAYLFPQSLISDVRSDYEGAVHVFEKMLLSQPESEWGSLLELMSSTNIPVSIQDVDSLRLSELETTEWLQGKIVVLDPSNDLLIKKLEGDTRGIQFGPIKTHDELNLSEFIASLGSSSILICVIFMVSLRLQYKLNILKKTTSQFSAGNFSVRAPENTLRSVGQLNFHFNRMAEEIEELVSTNRRLTLSVSHELRAPLTRMQFELEHALDLDNVQSLKDSYHIIGEEVKELEQLVNESLLYARYENNLTIFRLNSVNFDHWIRIWFDTFKSLDPKIKIIQQFQVNNVYTLLNTAGLTRAFDNILNNAVRHASKVVEVNVTSDNKFICTTIIDDGAGIPENEIEHIFKPFYRFEKGRKSSEGFGLGLSIAKEIISKHGGSIVAENLNITGASFTIKIPINEIE